MKARPQKSETALTAAFAKAGLQRRQLALYKPLSEFIQAGGTRDELLAVYYMIAPKMPEADHFGVDAQNQRVSDRQPNGESGGQSPSDNRGHPAATSPTPRDGSGQKIVDAQNVHAAPVREPSAAQTAADLAVKTRTALNAFDRELTRTGQRWGNVCYSELSNMTEDGEIANAIRMHIGSLRGVQALKPIRDLMTPREFAILFNKVRKGSN